MNRSRIRVVTLVLMALLASTISCSTSARKCNLTVSEPLAAGSWTVTYGATATGDGSVSQITYLDGAGVLQTVSNPSLPWTTTVTIPAPGTAEAGAVAETKDGSIDLTLEANDGAGTTLSDLDNCAQS